MAFPSAIAAAIGAAAGSSPPALAFGAGSRDDGALIFVGTGTATTTGTLVTVTFGGNYSSQAGPPLPKPQLTVGMPSSAAASVVYISQLTTSTAVISVAGTALPTGLSADATGIVLSLETGS